MGPKRRAGGNGGGSGVKRGRPAKKQAAEQDVFNEIESLVHGAAVASEHPNAEETQTQEADNSVANQVDEANEGGKERVGDQTEATKKIDDIKREQERLPEDEALNVRILIPAYIGRAIQDQLDSLKSDSEADSLVLQPCPHGAIEQVIEIQGVKASVEKLVHKVLSYSTSPSKKLDLIIADALIVYAHKAGADTALEHGSGRDRTGYAVNKSLSPLPNSSDRLVTISGQTEKDILDGVNQVLAIYATIKGLPEAIACQNQKHYEPISVVGQYGRPETFQRQAVNEALASMNPYISGNIPGATGTINADNSNNNYNTNTKGSSNTGNGGNFDGNGDRLPKLDSDTGYRTAIERAANSPGNQSLNQRVYVPADMVGSIIGRGGTAITELQQVSGASVKVEDTVPEQSPNYRVVNITGLPHSNRTALGLIYQKLEGARR